MTTRQLLPVRRESLTQTIKVGHRRTMYLSTSVALQYGCPLQTVGKLLRGVQVAPEHYSSPTEIRLRTKAVEVDILRDDPPAEVAELFSQDRLRAHLAKLKQEG
jgi:hypothetical protein